MATEILNTALPKSVVQEDQRLQKAEESASRALLKLRWHWTRDESNPKRVPIRVYAKAVGRHPSLIARDGKAHELLVDDIVDNPHDARERAQMSVETWEATEAVAKARGIGVTNARQHHKDEVERVRYAAKDSVEKGLVGSFSEAARGHAHSIVRGGRVRENREERRRADHTTQFVVVDTSITQSRRQLVEALNDSLGVKFTSEERELLLENTQKLQEALRVLETSIRGGQVPERKLEVIRGGLA